MLEDVVTNTRLSLLLSSNYETQENTDCNLKGLTRPVWRGSISLDTPRVSPGISNRLPDIKVYYCILLSSTGTFPTLNCFEAI